MTISISESKLTESVSVADIQKRRCNFGCKNHHTDCFRELICILYYKDSKILHPKELLIKILFNKFFFRLQFHGFSSFEDYFNEAELRGLIKVEKNAIRSLNANNKFLKI